MQSRRGVRRYVDRSLMLVSALSPLIGYDQASAVARKVNDEGTPLREAALGTGFVNADGLDRIVNPAAMVGRTGTAR